MKKILISWLATLNDFERGSNKVSKKGPTFEIHKHKNYNFDEHIILYSDNRYSSYVRNLIQELNNSFGNRRITGHLIEITDIWDVNEIKPKVQKVLEKYIKDEITVYTNPGTKPMFMAWILIAAQSIWNMRLVTLRDPEQSIMQNTDWMVVDLEKSPIAGIVLKDRIEEKNLSSSDTIITKSIKDMYDKVRVFAKIHNEFSLLIRGETGTGKEYLAREFHKNSLRKNEPFIAINCGAFDDDLLRSELFGYVKGSFTGAYQDKKGYFEICENGTLFMDEIGDISLKMQTTLLRVLNEKEFQKVGSTKTQKTNVNLIFATNKNLEQECQKGNFRYDLLHRISLPEIELPPFRNYTDDEKKEWINIFLKREADNLKRKELRLSDELYSLFLKYKFPGNIRELNRIIKNIYYECFENKDIINVSDLPKSVLNRVLSTEIELTPKEESERKLILDTLIKNNFNRSKTAKEIGISLNTLKKKIEDYGLEIPKEK
ncbi:MAG TPA: RNA repair transcriptional activator RtcR family protein [Bacteroidota bacterium]|nr:RNA repair transcriptional activator RtcR family protein [Bacteroidota bacterium]